jgi:hypothetical protein
MRFQLVYTSQVIDALFFLGKGCIVLMYVDDCNIVGDSTYNFFVERVK